MTAAETGSADDRTLDVGPGAVDGAFDILTLREASRDRRGQRAAGAVGMARRDPRALPEYRTSRRYKHVRHGFSGEMSAFDQHCPTAEQEQGFAGGSHLREIADCRAAQDRGFR